MPACTRCGRTDPRRMIGLMTLWFGPLVDMEPDYGYFHLCPRCYRDKVHPRFEEVHGRLAELHPGVDIGARIAQAHEPAIDRDSPSGRSRATRPSRTETQHA